jgi:hypothetical protein
MRRLLVPTLILLTFILLGVAINEVGLRQQRVRLPITVSFIGYTNVPKGERLAQFRIHNQSNVKVRRWGTFHPETQRNPGMLSTYHFAPNAFLDPGQMEIVSLSSPTNNEAWRAVFNFSRDTKRLEFSDWMGTRSEGLVDQLLPLSFRGIPSQFVESEWIEP